MPTVLSGPERWVQWSAFLLQSGIVWTGRSRIAAAQLLNAEGTVDRKETRRASRSRASAMITGRSVMLCVLRAWMASIAMATSVGRKTAAMNKDCGDEWGEEG